MRTRLEDLLGHVARAIWILTFHAACGRILRREAPRLGYKSNFTIYDQADQVRLTKDCLEELERDPKRFVPRGIHAQISNAKNQLISPAGVREPRPVLLRPDGRRRLRPLPAAPARIERRGLRRPADADRRGAGALPGGSQALAESVPLRPRRRVPGHEPRAVPPAPAARRASTGTSARSAIPTSRSTPSAAPTSATSSSSSATSPARALIALEQNYRSTNTILRAANAVIANNRERKEKTLFSDLGDGPPVRALEVEDEHAEARFVAAEVAELIEEGWSGSEIAVFYRTNAQSRVLEDVLVRQGIPYQVIGGPRFYERAEIKDAVAYLQVIDNPVDAVSLMRIANRPRRGIGDASLARLQRGRTRTASRSSPRSAMPRRPASAQRRRARCQQLQTLLHSLQSAAQELRSTSSWSACSSGPAISRRSRRSGRSSRAAASRTSRSSSASPASTRSRPRSRPSPASCRRSRSTPTRMRSRPESRS